MTTHDAGVALSAIQNYFDGERLELVAMLVGAVLFMSATGLLLFMAHDGFARGLSVPVLIFGAPAGGGSVSLLVRDTGLRSNLIAAIAAGPASRAALAEEKARIDVVISKYPIYRIAALVLAVLAIGGVLMSGAGWIHGAAAGLLLAAAAQVVIDHYSESRATIYLQRLAAAPAS